MIVMIDNLDMSGSKDWSALLDGSVAPKIERKLNQGTSMTLRLASSVAQMPSFAAGARVWLHRNDGSLLFSGYLRQAPVPVFLGVGKKGDVYVLELEAQGDESLLDAVPLPEMMPSVSQSVGALLSEVTSAVLPGVIDVSGVQSMGVAGVTAYDPGIQWSTVAERIAGSARAVWGLGDSKLTLAPVGSKVFPISASNGNFVPQNLTLKQTASSINDLTLSAGTAPGMYVKDYFTGDGATLSFSLSQTPYLGKGDELLYEEFGTELASQLWTVTDPNSAVNVSGGVLQCNGSASASGGTWVSLVDSVELGAPLTLELGASALSGTGVLGGLYSGTPAGTCVAGFSLSGGVLQPVINGVATGTTLTVVSGHKYVLRTRITGLEPFTESQVYRSSKSSYQDVPPSMLSRLVLDVQDIDPANSATLTTVAKVLYDAQVSGVPAVAAYAAVNGAALQSTVSYVRINRPSAVEVLTTPSGGTASTRLQGSIYEGSEYEIVSGSLRFHAAYPPASGMIVEARYRASAKACCRITDPTSIAALTRPGSGGVRPAIRKVSWPQVRTLGDCRSAALAVLDDSVETGWSGSYELMSDLLPDGVTDVFPGDGICITVPEVAPKIDLTVRKVTLEVVDAANDRTHFAFEFANDAVAPITVGLSAEKESTALELTAVTRGTCVSPVAPVPDADIVSVSGATLSVDMGCAPPSGGGFEVRGEGDWGWGTADKNLLGRYMVRSFVLLYNAKGQEYFVRMYDSATPPNYSPVSTLLYVRV